MPFCHMQAVVACRLIGIERAPSQISTLLPGDTEKKRLCQTQPSKILRKTKNGLLGSICPPALIRHMSQHVTMLLRYTPAKTLEGLTASPSLVTYPSFSPATCVVVRYKQTPVPASDRCALAVDQLSTTSTHAAVKTINILVHSPTRNL